MVQKLIADYLFNDKMKAKILKELNDNINIPIISEKTEGKILEAIWESIEAVLKKAILKS
tara:strand:+ start:1205 stop:1384 length:180 start_codon:yes stop_codon:yes gene_type:complete